MVTCLLLCEVFAVAFIVEDGTNVENANAYVTLEYADAYFTDRGNDSWLAFTTEQKQQLNKNNNALSLLLSTLTLVGSEN